jgi:hypothetical protein
MKYPEHELQKNCLTWFKMQYPKYSGLIFHIPNERKQSPQAGARAKAIGTLAGVADVFLSVPNEAYHGFYIEFKSIKGKMTDNQEIFRTNVLSNGYFYETVRTFVNFKSLIEWYLQK